MSHPEHQTAYVELSKAIQQLDCRDELLQQSLQAVLQPLQNPSSWNNHDDPIGYLKALATHFSLSCDVAPAYAERLAHVLAEATKREPLWRSLFGLPVPRSDLAFDSVLHVAMQVKSFHEKELVYLVKDSLRLIANCCADNNVHRKYCLNQNVLKPLLELALEHIESDTLIATLYNICIDYEDPGTSEVKRNDEQTTSEPTIQPVQSVSLAALKLVEASVNQIAAHQILLSMDFYCSEDRKAYLAELVELACVPFTQDDGQINLSTLAPNWYFEIDGQPFDTLTAMIDLVRDRFDCMHHVIRAVSFLLTNHDQSMRLLKSNKGMITKLITLIGFSGTVSDSSDADEATTEQAQCGKQMLRIFYQLTGSSDFIADEQSQQALVEESIVALMDPGTLPVESNCHYLMICYMIVLAQMAASGSTREHLLSEPCLISMLQRFLADTGENDLLYPTVTLISRLCRTDRPELVLLQQNILNSMAQLMNGKGRGLAIPFEVVDAFRMMIRNRPDKFALFTASTHQHHSDVMSAVIELFHKTIEAGTKIAVVHFFIEVLRTMFPQTKGLDNNLTQQNTFAVSSFTDFLDRFAVEVGGIFAYGCSQTGAREQRVHGWFGFGMLSVWKQGRIAILHAINDTEFQGCLDEVSRSEGPDAQNAKLMLSNLQQTCENNISPPTLSVLQSAATNFGIEFRCAT